MKTGTVSWFNPRKGYGFLMPNDGGFNVRVHIDAVERAGITELKVGQKIGFDIGVDERTGAVYAENLKALPAVPASLAGSQNKVKPTSILGLWAARKGSWFGGPFRRAQ